MTSHRSHKMAKVALRARFAKGQRISVTAAGEFFESEHGEGVPRRIWGPWMIMVFGPGDPDISSDTGEVTFTAPRQENMNSSLAHVRCGEITGALWYVRGDRNRCSQRPQRYLDWERGLNPTPRTERVARGE
jgi:hypothetical protein